MDESPRWLIVRGFHQKALKVLRRAEKANKANLQNDEEILSKMKEIEKVCRFEVMRILHVLKHILCENKGMV